MTTTKENLAGALFRPADIQLRDAVIAVLVERFADLDKDVKEDLLAVLREAGECRNQEELLEIEQTVRELLFPDLGGQLIVGQAGGSNGNSRLAERLQSVGGQIKRLREQRGWTQQELAEKSGLPQSHISKLETGLHSPSNKTLVTLATALDVALTEIDPDVE